MRRIHYQGRDIKLPERDWRQLLKRFDASRANLNLYGYYCIFASSLCQHYGYRCFQCPLGIIAAGTNRCTHLFNGIMGSEFSPYVYLFDPVVLWSPKFDSEARQGLDKVRAALSVDKSV